MNKDRVVGTASNPAGKVQEAFGRAALWVGHENLPVEATQAKECNQRL
jgi:uncharacterized protein YjbJ (UPF0337 family)